MNDDTPPVAPVAPVAEAFAIMYPWVCNGLFKNGTSDYDAYWGSTNNWENGVPFGTNSKYVNCYYDNEPWDTAAASIPGYDPHNYSDQPPPVWQAYKFAKPTQGGGILGWLIAAKYKTDQYGVRVSSITSRDKCGGYNGKWDPDNNTCSPTEFSLSAKDNPW